MVVLPARVSLCTLGVAAVRPARACHTAAGRPVDPAPGRPVDPTPGRPVDPAPGRPVDGHGGPRPPAP